MKKITYWPSVLVDEVNPESLGPPEAWLGVLLADKTAASEAENDEDDYAAVRGYAKVGDTVSFAKLIEWDSIKIAFTDDGYKLISGTVDASADWFAPSDNWEGTMDSLDALVAENREYYEVGDELDIDVCTWSDESWQIRSPTEIVQVEQALLPDAEVPA